MKQPTKTMKKLLLFFAIVTFASCSSDDDDKGNIKDGVEIVSYDVTEVHENNIYWYSFNINVKNHTNNEKTGKIRILYTSLGLEGNGHHNISLSPKEMRNYILDKKIGSSADDVEIIDIYFEEE